MSSPRLRRLRRGDAALLLLAALVLAATAVSVARSIALRQRLPGDRRAYSAWIARAGARYGAPDVRAGGADDIVCAATRSYRQCLLVSRADRVVGGFRLPPGTDTRGLRPTACFGSARRANRC